ERDDDGVAQHAFRRERRAIDGFEASLDVVGFAGELGALDGAAQLQGGLALRELAQPAHSIVSERRASLRRSFASSASVASSSGGRFLSFTSRMSAAASAMP